MERHDIIQQSLRGEIDTATAAARCNISQRQLYRLRPKVREHGVKGLIHGHTGSESRNAFSEKEKTVMKKIVAKSYADFGPTLAAEKLNELHNISVSKETLRAFMTEWKLWTPKKRRGNDAHREWRERRALFGELEQFDGCYHAWFEDRADTCCLLASIDDATGRITKLLFVDWEGVFPSFQFWREYLEKHGKPQSIYLDRHATYKVNAKTLVDDPEARSQFERASVELGIEIIHAHSPEGKGRIERLFKTLQDRLVKELRLAGISDCGEANQWMESVFIPAFNEKFGVVPRKDGDAHRVLSAGDRPQLDRIFSRRSIRVVMNDFTIRYDNRYVQLEKTSLRLVRRKEKIEVEENAMGIIKIFLRGAYLPHHELPERPQKAHVQPKLLAHARIPRKPALNHPWRKPLRLNSRLLAHAN